ncbi:ribose ABC superfamily ATP-binding protein [Marinobacterium zhoushanense]|uniref:Ribose ABC superfamily ATP-binding protein n=1 Tax=Marinobacterium zhoushanense TaxID=1679163 RepID=A0ABQ1KCS6_9GAMM|nr:substrate-binding domain-containing protein [Marinobacterium zhoushanense]GGB94044.1 ribose ABC superfamily ATP-binding protein [Marinobacterium zhoushanense]
MNARVALLSLCSLLVLALPVMAGPLSIGVSVSDLGNPYFQRIARAAEQQARLQAGDEVRVQVMSSAYDLERQAAQIDRFIAAGVDLILLSAASYDGLNDAIAKAHEAGIYVIAVDVQAAGADATVTTDNEAAGRLACDYLVRQLNGRGRVVIINGPPVSSVLERVEGCRDRLADEAEIELMSMNQNGGGSFEGGFEKMTHLLTAFPQIDAVFTINDPTALGAEQAANEAKRHDFIIASVDGAPRALQRLPQPGTLLRATAAQFPSRIAKQAIELGLRLVRGETLEQQLWLIPPELITAENVGEFGRW